MKSKFTAKLAGICVGGLLLAMPLTASADTYHNLLNQKNSISQQKQQVKSDLAKINAQVSDLTGKISKSQIEIGKTQDEIARLNKNIKETQQRLQERQDLLKERVIASYKNGGSSVNVLEILFGSKDFGDFINRAVAIYNITDHDNTIIQKQIDDQNLLKKQQNKVKTDLANAQAKVKELKQLVAKVEVAQAQKQAALSGLNNKSSKISGELAALSKPKPQPKSSNTSNHSSSNTNDVVQLSYIPSNVASGSVSDIVNAARRYFGNSHYVFGAMDPADGNFDCSGFVNWAYSQIGINLGSRSTSGLQYVGHAVSKGDLQPGDLVFFDTYKHNGHVGIYLGNGKFLGSQTGSGVGIADLNNPYYWGPRYSTARRVLN